MEAPFQKGIEGGKPPFKQVNREKKSPPPKGNTRVREAPYKREHGEGWKPPSKKVNRDEKEAPL